MEMDNMHELDVLEHIFTADVLCCTYCGKPLTERLTNESWQSPLDLCFFDLDDYESPLYCWNCLTS